MNQGRYRLGVLEGDGIGAEIVPASDAVPSGVSTRDLGGSASTHDFSATVVDKIDAARIHGGDGVAV